MYLLHSLIIRLPPFSKEQLIYYTNLYSLILYLSFKRVAECMYSTYRVTQPKTYFSFLSFFSSFFFSHPHICLFYSSSSSSSSFPFWYCPPHTEVLSVSLQNEETSPPSFHSHTHKLHYSILNQTHKSSLLAIYCHSNHTFHLQQSPPIYRHFQLPHFAWWDPLLTVFFVDWENLRIQNKVKGNLGIICKTSNGNNAGKSVFSYSI